MRRRRLRLHCSSDEEEEEEQQQQVPTTQNPNHQSPPFVISDDDFVDVSENLSPPSPPPPPPLNENSPVYEYLLKLGLNLRREWLNSCISGLTNSISGFEILDVSEKGKLCFQQFLFSDMNFSGAGLLPQNVHNLHLVDLPGPFVLQVDEIINLSCPLRGRYQNAPSGLKRCLKLSMTDGVQRVFGMEYRPINDLEVLAPAGFKVAIHNVNVRRGLLMLVPEVLEVLGGFVEDLDAARQRLVHVVNKPPRGKRTRAGSIPSLVSRATLAAWASANVRDHRHTYGSMSGTTTPLHSTDQAATLGTFGVHSGERLAEEFSVPNPRPNATSYPSTNSVPHPSASAVSNPLMNAFAGDADINMNDATMSMSGDNRERIEEVVACPRGRPNAVEEMNMNDAMMATSTDNREGLAEGFASARDGSNAELNQFSDAALDAVDISIIDEVEHAILLTGDKEIPFTYLASLFANWASKEDDMSYVQGKIKCVLTGVKGFQYKNRTKFELQVYADDGSLISEVLIDHSFVQNTISFSPEEVTAALTSSDQTRAKEIKEVLKSFQIFLANFEGIMLVEMNKTSPLPVVLQMNQGCPTADARSLLRRLKSLAVPQTPQYQQSEPIDISP